MATVATAATILVIVTIDAEDMVVDIRQTMVELLIKTVTDMEDKIMRDMEDRTLEMAMSKDLRAMVGKTHEKEDTMIDLLKVVEEVTTILQDMKEAEVATAKSPVMTQGT